MTLASTPRYSGKQHITVFLAHSGHGPWTCAYESCGKQITRLGRRRDEGSIHHVNEDKHDNHPENLEIMHFGCHRKHHMIGHVKTAETRQKLRDALRGHEVSAETRQKIGDANRGNTYCLGRVVSDETRVKLRAVHLGVKRPNNRSAEVWSVTPRDPLMCECGAGPFKGKQGLAVHRGYKHRKNT